MTLKTADRVLETTTSQGTGAVNLSGPTVGFRSFASIIPTASKVPYVIDDGTDWEVGIGTLTHGTPDSLARDSILSSSNSDAAVNWGPGTRNVRLSPLSSLLVTRDESLNSVEGFGTGGGTANAQTVTLTPAPLAYSDGMLVKYFSTVANTGPMTINVNGLGTKSLKRNGAELGPGAVPSGGLVEAVYKVSLGYFEILNAVDLVGAARYLSHAADTGSANAYAIAPAPGISAYVTGQMITLKPANNCTGGSTINVNAIGTKNIKLTNGQDPYSGAMITTGVYFLMYDGTNFILLNPEVIGKQTIWVPAGAMIPRTTNGAAAGTAEMTTNKNMIKTLDFDASTQEFAQFEIAMPKGWDLGTVTFQPVWSHPSTTTNFGVVWALQGIARSDDDALDVAFGTEQTSTDTGGTTNDLYIAPESSAITIGGSPAVGDVVQFQVKRVPANGSDTMAVDARLHGVKVIYTAKAGTDA
jgi:hypothetical protein